MPTSANNNIDKQTLLPGTVKLSGVSKQFYKATIQNKAKESYTTIKTSFLSSLFNRKKKQENLLTALSTLDVEVAPGSSLGLIGRNGSGKSTLLKLISGIYQPTTGTVEVSGRISALIELGAGFHPDFTGRENIYLGGVMYGLTKKEINERFDDIVSYAQLENFIDDPVRTYSSGMYMRLGFSLAVHTDPDILLIDEVLAVGDAAFTHRCHETISEFKRRGKTLIFVTHDLSSVARWCDDVIWLDKGVVRERGEPVYVIDRYLAAVEAKEADELVDANILREKTDEDTRWGNRDVEITTVRMKNFQGDETWMFHQDDSILIEVDYKINSMVSELSFGIGLLRLDGLCVHGTNTDIDDVDVPLPTQDPYDSESLTGTYSYSIKRNSLLEGSYYLDVAAHNADGAPYDYHHMQYKFSVRSKTNTAGIFNPEHSWDFQVNYTVNSKKRLANV